MDEQIVQIREHMTYRLKWGKFEKWYLIPLLNFQDCLLTKKLADSKLSGCLLMMAIHRISILKNA